MPSCLGRLLGGGPWERSTRRTSSAATTSSRPRAGTRWRILFATSNHAVGFYRRTQVIDHKVYIKPDGRYGVSKVFGEALGSLYADKYGMQVFLMRIGNVNPEPIDKRRLSIWLSPRDLAQLVQIGIDHPDVKFEIVYGVSGNKRSWYDNSNATRLGYRPLDNSEKFAEKILDEGRGDADPATRSPRSTREACSSPSRKFPTRPPPNEEQRSEDLGAPVQCRAARATRTCTSTTAPRAPSRARPTPATTPCPCTASCRRSSGSSASSWCGQRLRRRQHGDFELDKRSGEERKRRCGCEAGCERPGARPPFEGRICASAACTAARSAST